jgi:hypothetical protein
MNSTCLYPARSYSTLGPAACCTHGPESRGGLLEVAHPMANAARLAPLGPAQHPAGPCHPGVAACARLVVTAHTAHVVARPVAAHWWTGDGEVSGWSTGNEGWRRWARFEEVGTHRAMGRWRGGAEMAMSDDRDGVGVLWTAMAVTLCTRSSG